MVPTGKLNHPAVKVLDAENVILVNKISLFLQFQGRPFARWPCLKCYMGEGDWHYVNGITSNYEPGCAKIQWASLCRMPFFPPEKLTDLNVSGHLPFSH